MKKLLTIAALVLAVHGAQAQGTINFLNRIPGSLDQPVFDVGGTTRLDGAGFLAGLYEGVNLIGAAVPFRSGTGAGYWNPAPDATRTSTATAPGGTATLTVKAWEASGGSTYAAALAAGKKTGSSAPFTVVTGGAGAPPSLPGDMLNFKSFSLVPEPSVLALGALGAVALLFRRRK